MLEHFYKERRALVDFRRGPLGEHFDGFAENLKKYGFTVRGGKTLLGKCCLFNDWLVVNNINDCKQISESHMNSFLDEYLANTRTTRRYNPRSQAMHSFRHLILYLEERGIINPFPKKTEPVTPYSSLVNEFLSFIAEEKNLSKLTLDNHRRLITSFLEGIGSDNIRARLLSFTAEDVSCAMKRHIVDSLENRKSLGTALRKFFRFCAVKKYMQEDFSGLVPTVPSYRHASLPKGMEDSALERMLNVIPKDTLRGARDYAIMLLLMAYGIRGKSVAELLLEDIRWQNSTIRIRAQKGGKEVVLPLLDTVGEAILAYLRNRPDVPRREIFLVARIPYNPLNSVQISRIVNLYMKAAGVKKPNTGSNTLRHSWAIRALAHDTPIKSIADVLGHRYVDTTLIYAKADLKMLKYVAMPWPDGR
jgi:integrase/recombinase XerD